MKNSLILASLCLLCSAPAWAQPVGARLTNKQITDVADERYGANDGLNAVNWYKKAYDRDSDKIENVYNLAMAYHSVRNYAEAKSLFKAVMQSDKDAKYPLSAYFYALNTKQSGNYDEAIKAFESFAKSYQGDDAELYKRLTANEIAGAKYAQGLTTDAEELMIDNMGKNVNSPSTEGAAFAMGRNTIIYSSLRTDTLIYLEEEQEGVEKFAQIYTSSISADGKSWTPAKKYNVEALAKEGFHIVHPTFNKAQDKFYFVRAQLAGNNLANSKIYVCDNNDGVLSEPKALDFNSDDYSCKNPTIAVWEGSEYLIFSSDMPGSEGGFDLWAAQINADGTTKTPLNLSSKVNTAADEIAPFFDERDNNLYFASNGHPSLGGFDLFTVERNPQNAEWLTINNMGKGFNSPADEFGFTINKEGRDDCYGYVISNRKSTMSMEDCVTCGDDIFSILMPERCDIIVEVDIFDEETGEPLVGATVQLIDKKTGQVIDEQANRDGNDYTFLVEMNQDYTIKATKDNHTAAEVGLNTDKEQLKEKGFETTKPIELDAKLKIKELGLVVQTFDKKTNTPLNGVTVVVYEAKSAKEVTQSTESDNEFEFNIARDKEYRLLARRNGYISDSRTITAAEMSNIQKLYLTPPPIFINIYFDFDKHNLDEKAVADLQKVLSTLQVDKDMIVEVRGHTDALGTDGYNQKLSEKRSNATIDYLVEKGISKDRLVLVGLGEKEPTADNTLQDGKDNPEGRQLNRRVEFKVVKKK